MSDTPETDAFFFRIDIDWDMEVEFARKLERERNDARDMVEKLTAQGLKLMDDNRMLKRGIKKFKKTIQETLEENRHLADGSNCTLRKLKQLVPDWE
jgi:3-oxoacyl-[acyl-carrier-protein] synthase III